MNKANELTQQIISHFFKAGGFAWRSNTTGLFDARLQIYRPAAKKGVADVLGVISGRFVAVEVKIARDRLSPEQEGFLANVRHAGGVAFVAHSLEEFLSEFEKIIPCG